MTGYSKLGYKNRNDYLKNVSKKYGVPLSAVLEIAGVLGDTEDFDALVTELEDSDDFYHTPIKKSNHEKQFTVCVYKDNNFINQDKCYELDWADTIDDIDWEDWCYKKLSDGHSIVIKDWKNKDILYYKYDVNKENAPSGMIDDFIYDARELDESVQSISNGQVEYVGFDDKDNDKINVETKGYWTYVEHQRDSFTRAIIGYVIDKRYFEENKDYYITKNKIGSHKYMSMYIDNGTNHPYIAQVGLTESAHGVESIEDGVKYIISKNNLSDKSMVESIDRDYISYNDFLSNNFVGWEDADNGFDELIRALNSFARKVKVNPTKLIFCNVYPDIYNPVEISNSIKDSLDVYNYNDITFGKIYNTYIFKNEGDAETILNVLENENEE